LPLVSLLALASCSFEQEQADQQPLDDSNTSQVQVETTEVNLDAGNTADSKANVVDDEIVSTIEEAAPITPENTKELIEDLGFSGVDDDFEQQVADTQREVSLYCLNSGTESQISVEMACERISNRLSSISYENCASAELQQSGCLSVEGFPILVREFPPIETKIPRGRILVVGGTHGDELTSVSIMFRWIEKLNRFHSGLYHWHMAPMMNPDGVLKKGATRTNHNGVDLNRNLPTDDWRQLALEYWEKKGKKSERKYPGQEPASEPEVQWLIDEIETFKPDAIIAVHAPYGIVDFDSQILNTAPKSLGKLHLNLLGTYPGSLGNYAGIDRNIPVITLELPHSWIMMSEAESTQIWEDIVSWLRRNVGPELAYETGE